MNKWLSSISTKILLGYAAILITTLITAFPLISTNTAVEQKVETFVQQTLPQLGTIRNISSELKQLELNAYSLYGLTMTSKEFESQSAMKTATLRRELEDITSDNVMLDQYMNEFTSQLNTLHTTMTTKPVDWDSARGNLLALSATSESMAVQIELHTQSLALSAQTNSSEIIQEMTLALKLLITLMTVIFAVALTAYFYSRKQIAQPIKNLSLAATRITEGDFKTEIAINSNDEIGKLADTFNQMQSGIAKREERIIRHAHYDELTGLANSTLMSNRIDAVIERADLNKSTFSLVLLNLKRFKDINSAFGHAHGDAVIKEVSKRILTHVKNADLVARTNGDKFFMLLEDTEELAAASYTSALIKQLTQTIEIDSTSITLSVCAGIVSYPEHGSDTVDLLRQVDVAMNQAKDSFSEVTLFKSGIDQGHIRQLSIIRDLGDAVKSDELMLYYQPKIDSKTNQLIGVEALIRWIHPELGFMPPDEFIPIAERSGNIGLITCWVLQKAIAQCQSWNDEGLHIKMSVNLSAIDLLDQTLPNSILSLLEKHEVHPSQLVLEITESTVLRDTDLALLLLNQLKDAGINLSIDDYGTDFSSLAKLRELPVHELKIDKSFVMNMIENENDTVIVKSTIDLGHNMGLRITAEGVEDKETLILLNQLGCDEIQGYFISRPLPISDFAGWVKEYEQKQIEAELVIEA